MTKDFIPYDNTKIPKTASKEFDDFLESVKAMPDQKPICEYSGLPSVTSYTDQQEDYVDKLAIELWKASDDRTGNPPYIYSLGVEHGYNKAKETLYTEEQAIEFAKWLASNWFPMWVKDKFVWEHDWDKTCEEQKYKGYYNEKELFSLFLSLKQPK